MGFVDKTYVQEVIDDMIYNINRKKRSLEDSMMEMKPGESFLSGRGRRLIKK